MASSKSSPSSKLKDAVSQTLKQHLSPLSRVIVAYSGGVDSTVLLHTAKQCSDSLNVELSAVHVHHGLSPHADAWAATCQQNCKQLSVPLTIKHITVPTDTGEGIEAAARRLRFGVFNELDCDAVLLGQHRRDQAETLLLNLLRGTGVRGAAGMPAVRGKYLRPLLAIGRDEIEAYALENQLNWIVDESNSDSRFSRNFLRNEIFPLLAKRYPAVDSMFASASANFAEAQLLLDDLAKLDLGASDQDFPLEISCLRPLSEARARNVLRYLLAKNAVQVPSSERLTEALQQMLTAAPDRHPSIRFGMATLLRKQKKIYLEKNDVVAVD